MKKNSLINIVLVTLAFSLSSTPVFASSLIGSGIGGKYLKAEEGARRIETNTNSIKDINRRLKIMSGKNNKGDKGDKGDRGVKGPEGMMGSNGESFYAGHYNDLDMIAVIAVGGAISNVPSPTSDGLFIGAGASGLGGVNAGAIGVHYVDDDLVYKVTVGYSRNEQRVGVGIGYRL